ncbi:Acyl-coenzyme A oxidase-like protein [Fusarium odoratissimum]|uniref:Acyl-coenzyme A oxidase-like protein n=1 Tax=Fusarium oxysporum f. sp. cubense (strain race 4) TaxID=2502994 RepID=N1RTR8_FUSC4|nr:Acyl-coenzyme A oxidase-like protein [Fusarium odoratissimum]
MFHSKTILNQEIWQRDYDVVPPARPVDVALHYERAKSMCRHSDLTLHDIEKLTKRFWDFHFDRTLSHFAKARPDLQDLLTKLLSFEICGEFMLTEIGHGLDARNLETTATLQADGSFELHTPTTAASKVMPPTTPYCGIPRVAIVFARLMVRGKNQGVKPFIVFLSDADAMRPGVSSRILPTRPGTKPLDHAITTFNRVQLPYNALLGSPAKPENERAEFLCHIRRVAVGTLSLSIMGISAIRVGTRIAALYSERRTITAPDGHSAMPIIGFSTQQRPIVEGWVQGKILTAFAHWAVGMCPDPAHPTQHALATIFKATGNSIAEGDTLVLCIRLVSELLGGKLQLPTCQNALAPLAQQEHQLMTEIQSRLTEIGGYGKHRTEAFNQHILPFCRPLVETIGHRMAYEAAQCSGISPDVLELYERLSTGKALIHLPAQDVSRVRCEDPLVDEQYETIIAQIRSEAHYHDPIDDYITAPIVSEEKWENFTESLLCFFPPASLDKCKPKL